MLLEKPPIAKEGYPFIGYLAFLTILCAVLGYSVAALVLAAATTFTLLFFRDPERQIPSDNEGIVSPADGKVIIVENVRDERFCDEEVLKISIFMNVFNVHVNRVPFPGIVEKIRYVPGKFLAADNEKAHLKNEYCAITLSTQSGHKLTFVQIAGLIARRIVCRLEPGDKVVKGERFGLIRFGSRVDLYLPNESRPAITVGQKVIAGETIIARIGTDR